MYAVDFEYDGQYLSDYGFIICDFNKASGFETVNAGSKIIFNTVARGRGRVHSLAGTEYGECVSAKFSICKNPCLYNDLRITNDEYRDIMRWLNRNEFLKFRLLNDDDDDRETCYYEGSFNVEKVTMDSALYGMIVTMTTNKPFGYGQELAVSWNITDTSKRYTLSDMSDEVGYTYPSMTITICQDGDFSIHNDIENCTMIIKNCKDGEVITVDGDAHIVRSSIDSHELYDDFNFEFFRIGNTINNRNNKITVSLQCKLEIRYSPIIKDTPD